MLLRDEHHVLHSPAGWVVRAGCRCSTHPPTHLLTVARTHAPATLPSFPCQVLSPATIVAVDLPALMLLDLPGLAAFILGVLSEEFAWVAKSFPVAFGVSRPATVPALQLLLSGLCMHHACNVSSGRSCCMHQMILRLSCICLCSLPHPSGRHHPPPHHHACSCCCGQKMPWQPPGPAAALSAAPSPPPPPWATPTRSKMQLPAATPA